MELRAGGFAIRLPSDDEKAPPDALRMSLPANAKHLGEDPAAMKRLKTKDPTRQSLLDTDDGPCGDIRCYSLWAMGHGT